MPVVVTTGCLCAIPAVEMALRAFQDLEALYQAKNDEVSLEENDPKKSQMKFRCIKISNELIQHTIGSLFLGVCAANIFPGSALVGALGFMIYSKITWKKEVDFTNPSFATFGMGLSLQFLSIIKKDIVKSVIKITQTSIELVFRASKYILVSIYHIAQEIIGAAKQVVHVIKVTAKGMTKAFKTLILLPGKFVVGACKVIGKAAIKAASIIGRSVEVACKALIRHPLIGLGFLAVGVCLSAILINASSVAGLIGKTAAIVGVVAKGIFSGTGRLIVLATQTFKVAFAALGYLAKNSVGPIGKIISGTVSVIGTVLSYVPAAIAKTFFVIAAIAKFIFRI